MKFHHAWMILVTLLLLCACAAAVAECGTLRCALPTSAGTEEILTTLQDGEEWLLLPSFADTTRLTLTLPGHGGETLLFTSHEAETLTVSLDENGSAMVNLESCLSLSGEEEDGERYTFITTEEGTRLLTLNVMQSGGVHTFFLHSDNPAENRAWVEDCEKHEHITTANYRLADEEGQAVHSGAISALRGRGNATWSYYRIKKPYHFKLQTATDLLNTNRASKVKTRWVLLAMDMDASLLHDRIGHDLAKEVGADTVGTMPVDLYYDGEYRGAYLLCEHVEAGRGQVELPADEEKVRLLNKGIREEEWENLPTASGVNRYGQTYTWVEGLNDTGDPSDYNYFLEIEHDHTLSSPCWFTLSNNKYIGVKSPEHLTQEQMRWISEKLETLVRTLQNGGTDPDTGTPLADQMDLENFALYAFLQELIGNKDGLHGSSYFVLRAKSDRFTAGPLWDMDMSMRYLLDKGNSARVLNDTGNTDFLNLLYHVPEFREAIREVGKKVLPVVKNTLLGEKDGESLRTLHSYIEEISFSRRMNERMLSGTRYAYYRYGRDWETETELLRSYWTDRVEWLEEVLSREETVAEFQLHGMYTNFDETLSLRSALPCFATATGFEYELLSEADEENDACYAFEFTVKPEPGVTLEGLIVNGVRVTMTENGDGTYQARGRVWDPSYRPVDWEGTDVGLIYREEDFRQNYPEISAEFIEDSEGLLAYFMEEGIYEGLKGNAFFDPKEVADCLPEYQEQYADNWDAYYEAFLESGAENPGQWMKELHLRCVPRVEDEPEG